MHLKIFQYFIVFLIFNCVTLSLWDKMEYESYYEFDLYFK